MERISENPLCEFLFDNMWVLTQPGYVMTLFIGSDFYQFSFIPRLEIRPKLLEKAKNKNHVILGYLDKDSIIFKTIGVNLESNIDALTVTMAQVIKSVGRTSDFMDGKLTMIIPMDGNKHVLIKKRDMDVNPFS